jgi:hypothetical protein
MQPSALGVPGGVELAIILFVMFPLLFVWIIGLSALGGMWVRISTRTRRRAVNRGLRGDEFSHDLGRGLPH